jgi:hypothetical protein
MMSTEIQQKELNDIEIGHAMHISMELMLEDVQSRITKLTEQREQVRINKKLATKHEALKGLKDYLETEALKEARKFSKFKSLTRLMNDLTAFGGWMPSYSTDAFSTYHGLTNGNKEYMAENGVSAWVTVEVENMDIQHSTQSDNPGYRFAVDLTQSQINALKDVLMLSDEEARLSRLLYAARSERDELPKKANRLKAELLAQELNRSDRGKQVLETVSRMVIATTGKKPEMLELK